MTDTRWYDVPEAADLWEGDLIDVEVDGEPILVVHHLDGSYAAYQGLCPHQEILLADGKWDEETCVLTCSGHLWEFDLATGEGLNPAGSTLYRYEVRATGDAVQIGIPQDDLPHYSRFREQE